MGYDNFFYLNFVLLVFFISSRSTNNNNNNVPTDDYKNTKILKELVYPLIVILWVYLFFNMLHY